MAKAELFDIEEKKDNQRKAEMAMTPAERLLLCLDLIDLYNKMNPSAPALPLEENIEWIDLPLKNND
jgi:hypothetical protein